MHPNEGFEGEGKKTSVMNFCGRKSEGSGFKRIDSVFSLSQNLMGKISLVI